KAAEAAKKAKAELGGGTPTKEQASLLADLAEARLEFEVRAAKLEAGLFTAQMQAQKALDDATEARLEAGKVKVSEHRDEEALAHVQAGTRAGGGTGAPALGVDLGPAFVQQLAIELKLTIDGKEVAVDGGRVRDLSIELHTWGFEAELEFMVSLE